MDLRNYSAFQKNCLWVGCAVVLESPNKLVYCVSVYRFARVKDVMKAKRSVTHKTVHKLYNLMLPWFRSGLTRNRDLCSVVSLVRLAPFHERTNRKLL